MSFGDCPVFLLSPRGLQSVQQTAPLVDFPYLQGIDLNTPRCFEQKRCSSSHRTYLCSLPSQAVLTEARAIGSNPPERSSALQRLQLSEPSLRVSGEQRGLPCPARTRS